VGLDKENCVSCCGEDVFLLFCVSETGSPVFDEFLNLIGQKVRLKGFEKYRGGLDCKSKCSYSSLLCSSDYVHAFMNIICQKVW